MNPSEISKLSDEELRSVILTVDGKGKTIKELALEEIIRRIKN